MNKKVFRAENMQEALACVKAAMGADAMILSTRKVPKKPLDPYSKDMFEVEAAVAEPLVKPRPKPKPVFDTPAPVPAKEDFGDVAALREELSEIKDLISLVGFGSGVAGVLDGHLESVGVLASFVRAGVSEGVSMGFIERAAANIDAGLSKEERIRQLKQQVMKTCLDKIRVQDMFQLGVGAPHIAAFVGPTGVGKTTTIAKLAALLTFSRKMKVGLISIDNYRIGAFEQLKSYASIMGLLCVPAFNSSDLSHALERMGAMDVVLIDTAGHSHFDLERLNNFQNMIQSDRAISVHLTLSVTSELITMKEAASAFSVLNPTSYVFTKVDETHRCGKILDQILDYNLPVSMVTNGQKVPEDLVIPDKQHLLKIILGKGSGREE